jgi:acetyltransferase-like isoleucine patch superfamily enzyme
MASKKFPARLRAWLNHANTIDAAAHIDAGAHISGCTVKGPAVLGAMTAQDSAFSGKIAVGSHTEINASRLNGEITVGPHGKLHKATLSGNVTIGKYTSLWGPDTDVVASDEFPVRIGSFCSIARNVAIQSYNHNFRKPTSYFIGKNFFNEKWVGEQVSPGGITIGNDVWIGTQVVVVAGVTIGNGAVIGAGSVVTRDIPPYAIAVGSPAKVTGYRFSESVIGKLQQLAWWDWDDEKIRRHKAFFQTETDEEMLGQLLKGE